MAQIWIASVRFSSAGDNEYLTDAGQQKNIIYNPRVPFSLFGTNLNSLSQIYNAGGGQTTKIAGNVIVEGAGNSVCSDTDNVTPRKLIFFNAQGESISVPLEDGLQGVAVANTVAGLLSNTPFGNPVCIRLEGERLRDLFGELGGNFTGVPATVQNTSRWYSGQTDYQLDTSETITIPVKVASEDRESPPDAIASAWATCVGDLLPVRGCGNRGQRITPRKFIAQYIVGNNVGGENAVEGDASNEIPVADADPAEIVACANNIIQEVTGLYCLPYEGESDLRYDFREGVNI